MKTNNENVDKLAGDILADITTSSMTTFQKVKAVHNYLVQTSVYEHSGGGWNFDYVSSYDGDVVILAEEMLSTKKGVCYNFAAVFMILTRRIGLDSYMMSGYIDYNGGQSSHYWNIIRINGVEYLIDTQADWRNSDGGPTRYTNFGLTNTPKYHYDNKEGTYAAFNNFERYPEG
ncbi:MAG: transglutaminase domain-containing protein [Clostridia bacterium]|nr:transglutaminase domain-containing protein [Clostridia bacterium]